ncbi:MULTISPECIES: hypothetical protein [Nocardia]|nr:MULTISPECIES: hypothetical protein [Nocardia]
MSRTKRLVALVLLPLSAVAALAVVGPTTAGTAAADPGRVHCC